MVFVPKISSVKNVGTGTKVSLLDGLKDFFTNKNQIILGLSGFMFMFVNIGFSTWASKFIQSLGYSASQGGNIVIIFNFAGIFSTSLSGWLAIKLKMTHKKFILITLICLGVLAAIFFNINALIGIMVAAFFFGALAYMPPTHYTSIAAQHADERHAATAMSTQNWIFQLSGLIQPLLIGYALDKTNNYSMIFYVFATCIILSIILLLFAKEKKQIQSL